MKRCLPIHMNTCMIGKISMKRHYLKNKIFTVIKTWKILLIQITWTQKKDCKYFEIKHLGEYHNLYVQSNAFFLADVFKNIWDICFEIYELDPAHFLKLMVGKGIRGGICHAVNWYAKANIWHMKDYGKNKESLYLN